MIKISSDANTDFTASKPLPIIYTITDEAPALATHSLLPIVKHYCAAAGVDIVTADISLSGRILDVFAQRLNLDRLDTLNELGKLTADTQANIVKLPNISASVPQLKAAIAELQKQGFELPDYVEETRTRQQREIRSLYDSVKGSAVNPVLREGNSDRRAPVSVKKYVRANPHAMGAWSKDSPSRVVTMDNEDFFHNEKSVTVAEDTTVAIRFTPSTQQGSTEANAIKAKAEVLCEIELIAGEILDATFMSVKALRRFYDKQVLYARQNDLLFSLHLKATMMKVSDPILFGHGLRSYFADVFEKHEQALRLCDADANNGLSAIYKALEKLDEQTRQAISADIENTLAKGPGLAMVNSDRGITNLHVPSDVIIDASMPAMIRTSAKMWNRDGKLQDTLAVIPDSCYAQLYSETFKHCREFGAFNPATMGTVSNVGLMAQKAQEYGSHDKTFEIPSDGTVEIVDSKGHVLISHRVSVGDIYRACQAKPEPIRNWVELAVKRTRVTRWPAVFWLDSTRSHDAEVIKQVEKHLATLDTSDLDISIMNVAQAARYSLSRARAGQNTISVTGNVLRDYLTDLFPILELGTSAKMLSVVPLINGGGLFETGAGGSAPRHVQQFLQENHLRWDSLGEFLALTVSFEHYAETHNHKPALELSRALEGATEMLLHERRSPSRKVYELDSRGSHYYLARYWAEALAAQNSDPELRTRFAPLARTLAENEERIIAELSKVQGTSVDIGGYYAPDFELSAKAMRPSHTFNTVLTNWVRPTAKPTN